MKTIFSRYSSETPRKKETVMKHIFTTLAIASTIILVGCGKTNRATLTTPPQSVEREMDVDVEIEEGEIIVMINGEEKVIELGESMGDIDFENIDGEMNFTVMAFANEEGDYPMHRMQMRGDRGDRGGQGGPPEEMREHMNQMYGWQEENTHGEWRDDRPHRQHEGSEIIEFMHELELFSEVSSRLSDSKAVAMIGIHMIRDELDGELKMKAIDAIIKKSERGSPAHNAALIVAIQTMQEEGDDEAAADYMIELVISN